MERVHTKNTKKFWTEQTNCMANEMHTEINTKYGIVAVFVPAFRCNRKVDERRILFSAWNFWAKHIQLLGIGLRFDHHLKYVRFPLFRLDIQLSLHTFFLLHSFVRLLRMLFFYAFEGHSLIYTHLLGDIAFHLYPSNFRRFYYIIYTDKRFPFNKNVKFIANIWSECDKKERMPFFIQYYYVKLLLSLPRREKEREKEKRPHQTVN